MTLRIIRNYSLSDIDLAFLYDNNDWDIIELNYKIDGAALQEWWRQVEIDFNFMKFNFTDNADRIDMEISKEMVDMGLCGYYCGPIDGMTLAWPVERYEPLPPPTQANRSVFPEVNLDTFIDDAKILTRFNFGYFNTLLETLGYDSFRQALVTTHHPRMYIRQHIDSKVLKLHIPIETNENALFHFGENKERSYHMQVGRVYILNTGDWHGTSNESDLKRSHIITRVTKNHILDLIGMSNI